MLTGVDIHHIAILKTTQLPNRPLINLARPWVEAMTLDCESIILYIQFDLDSDRSSHSVPVAAGTPDPPTWQLQVPQADTPLWFHCKQPNGNHCGQGEFPDTSNNDTFANIVSSTGMVFAVNPPDQGDHTFEAFQGRARATLNTNATATTTSVWSTPSPQPWSTATATVTNGTSVWTTTYTSYLGSVRECPSTRSRLSLLTNI